MLESLQGVDKNGLLTQKEKLLLHLAAEPFSGTRRRNYDEDLWSYSGHVNDVSSKHEMAPVTCLRADPEEPLDR
jgi:hypothetical protein